MSNSNGAASGLEAGHPQVNGTPLQESQTSNTLSPQVNGHTNGITRSARSTSAPLAPAFMVSAPGKVIVFGEHAVVHGKAAMAAAISLRSYLLCTTLSKSQRTITLRFHDISPDHTWRIDDLPWAAFNHPQRKKRYYDLVTSLDPELVQAMQPCIQQVSANSPEKERKIHQATASTFLYLFLSIGSQNSPPCTYTLRSTIPIGAGLGSSASCSVCIATALLLQSRALSGPHPDQLPEEAEKQLERINQWAFVGEMLIHGNPSGVDNTVATRGKAVLFKRADYSKPPLVRSLRQFPELPLLLVDTKQAKSTAVEVAKVGTLKKTHPAVGENVLAAIDSITESAHALITEDDFDPARNADAIVRLGELVSINHGLLYSLGVSHPKLERLKLLVDQSGIGWTKLTGAGGGGCAITLLKPSTTTDHEVDNTKALHDLERELEKEGFEKYETTLGGNGVGVLWPAVLRNGSDARGGEEIDEDKFDDAVGRERIEKLVGVNALEQPISGAAQGETTPSSTMREGWKYWRY